MQDLNRNIYRVANRLKLKKGDRFKMKQPKNVTDNKIEALNCLFYRVVVDLDFIIEENVFRLIANFLIVNF